MAVPAGAFSSQHSSSLKDAKTGERLTDGTASASFTNTLGRCESCPILVPRGNPVCYTVGTLSHAQSSAVPPSPAPSGSFPRSPPELSLLRRYTRFFFQAEDGIRDGTVTGVQTCALPI